MRRAAARETVLTRLVVVRRVRLVAGYVPAGSQRLNRNARHSERLSLRITGGSGGSCCGWRSGVQSGATVNVLTCPRCPCGRAGGILNKSLGYLHGQKPVSNKSLCCRETNRVSSNLILPGFSVKIRKAGQRVTASVG